MRVFKYALALAARKPLYFLIYAVGLSFMGVAMALAATSAEVPATPEAVARPEVPWALVDRDGSTLSRGLAQGLASLGERVDVADDALAMEECVAQGEVDCLFVVPDGFGARFMDAAHDGTEAPSVDAAYGFTGAGGALASAAADRWLAAAAVAAAADPGAGEGAVAEAAEDAFSHTVAVAALPSAEEGESQGVNAFTFYLQWSVYTVFASVIACTAALFSTFNRPTVRRRDLASPVTFASYTAQVALASLVVTAACWAAPLAVGLAFFGADACALGAGGLALTLAASFAFCLVPLAVSFLAGQFGCGFGGANALGNLLGMAVSFLGGAWVPLGLLGPEIQAAARFTPGWWYTDALTRARELSSAADPAAALGSAAQDLAVVLLFAVTVFLMALVAGRLRTQTAETA